MNPKISQSNVDTISTEVAQSSPISNKRITQAKTEFAKQTSSIEAGPNTAPLEAKAAKKGFWGAVRIIASNPASAVSCALFMPVQMAAKIIAHPIDTLSNPVKAVKEAFNDSLLAAKFNAVPTKTNANVQEKAIIQQSEAQQQVKTPTQEEINQQRAAADSWFDEAPLLQPVDMYTKEEVEQKIQQQANQYVRKNRYPQHSQKIQQESIQLVPMHTEEEVEQKIQQQIDQTIQAQQIQTVSQTQPQQVQTKQVDSKIGQWKAQANERAIKFAALNKEYMPEWLGNLFAKIQALFTSKLTKRQSQINTTQQQNIQQQTAMQDLANQENEQRQLIAQPKIKLTKPVAKNKANLYKTKAPESELKPLLQDTDEDM